MISSRCRSDWIAAASALAWSAGVFLVAPGLHGLDSSELALVPATFGIGHPPGQLPHVLLTRAAQGFPLGDLAFRSNLFSWITTAACFWLAGRVGMAWASNGFSRSWARLAGFAAALCPFVFSQAVRTEVYALSSALLLGVLLFAARDDARSKMAAFALFGLAALNHPVMAAAAIPFLPWRSVRAIVWMGVPCLLLAYFPIRSATVAAWNFGHAESLSLFWAFLRGDLYAGAPRAAFSWFAHLRGWSVAVVENVPIGLLLLALAGAVEMFRENPKRLVQVAMGTILLSFFLLDQSNYWPNNPDAQGYQSILVWFLAILAGGALSFARTRARWLRVAAASLAVLGIVQGLSHPDVWSYRDDAIASEQVSYLMNETEGRGAIHASSFFTYASLSYAQRVEGRRSDARVTYRGDRFAGPIEPGTNDAIELLLGLTPDGTYALDSQDRSWVARGLDCPGWFCSIPSREDSATASRFDSYLKDAASELGVRQEFVKEPFVLNAIVRILAARVRKDGVAEERSTRELFSLFPDFAEYNLLEKNP